MRRSDRDVRVCFVGDSFVAGVGDGSALGWVGRVVAASATRALPLTAYNLGVRRDTSEQVADRLAREVAPRLAPAAEPRVVVSFGVNDTALDVDARPRVDVAGTLAALRRIATDVGPVPLLLVGPVAVDDDDHNARSAELDAALRDESSALGVPCVSVLDRTARDATWRREVRAGDGAHPGAAGYAVLAGLVEGPVLDWIG
ncbi:lysophospholipase L1-like esterase [Cellulosimicrobium cellulans]|uniref:GDSL-type esterase/lipase family protein n=1 Tax=Cellulosimicrobium cellulans TaxID=1710 RepID=UPI00195CA8EA|nr:GDSL-type esterase/lipase family protein [Cellulosimicrobium cellulans]MBM7818365.1 lysophospholipase L1-like esterase [Cellulosimicrobium cellulans]